MQILLFIFFFGSELWYSSTIVSLIPILIIDDEPSLIQSIERLLIDDMYQIEKASDGKEGLKKVFEVSPHVVIVDYRMPKMNGVEFVKALSTLRPDIPVIVMTAFSDDIQWDTSDMVSIVHILDKPFDIDHAKLLIKQMNMDKLCSIWQVKKVTLKL